MKNIQNKVYNPIKISKYGLIRDEVEVRGEVCGQFNESPKEKESTKLKGQSK